MLHPSKGFYHFQNDVFKTTKKITLAVYKSNKLIALATS